jgi:two-component system, NtrC family, sensor kinase
MLRLKNRVGRYAPVVLIATIGVGLTLAVTGILQQIEQQRLITEHQQKVAQITTLVQAEVSHNLDASVTLANFIDASDQINSAQLQKFGQHLLKNHRGLLSLAWVKAVLQADRPVYEAQFGPIRDRLENGQFILSPTRSVYFPENQLVPLTDRVGVKGWELGGDVVRRRALQAAYKTNAVQVTELIPLPNGSNGFVTFVPVPPPSEFAELHSVRGFVRSIFPLREFVQNVVSQVRHQPGQDLYLLSDATAQHAFWVKIDGATQVAEVHLGELPQLKSGMETLCPLPTNCFKPIAVGQFQWRLLVSQGAIKPSQAFESQLWLFRLLGLGSTIALVAYMLINLRQTRQIAALAQQKTAQTQQLTTTLSELQETQAQLVQSAKMSSLGQLVAGIAHEVNNPVNFIHGNLRHVERYSQDLLTIVDACQASSTQPQMFEAFEAEYELDFLRTDLPKLLQSMHSGTQRIREIVLNLRNFSRLDEAELKVVNLHDGIESTLMILQHRLGTIALDKQYGDLPRIRCYPGLLNQVLMNLVANAIDAVTDNPPDRPAQITIQTRLVGDLVQIGIGDNGSGISEAHQASLFNPFFTTKPVGEGTGLGLSISYKIITEQHKGRIWAESRLGQGTTFWMALPQPNGATQSSTTAATLSPRPTPANSADRLASPLVRPITH